MRLQQEAYKYGENNEKAQYEKALKNRETLTASQMGSKMSSAMNITTLENELELNESSLKVARMARDEINSKIQEVLLLGATNELKKKIIQRELPGMNKEIEKL